MKRYFFILFIFLLALQPTFAKVVSLDIYRSWYGENSEYKSEKPFFIIYDLYELERFWAKCNSDEQMPWIDFDKTMLFVWNPGQTLHSCKNAKVTNFLFKDNKYVLLMKFAKSYCGGGWKHPFLATLLPRVKKGDIFVMRTESKRYGEIRWVPVFSIWDMQQGREAPFEVAKQDKPIKKDEFITHRTKIASIKKITTNRPASINRPVKPQQTIVTGNPKRPHQTITKPRVTKPTIRNTTKQTQSQFRTQAKTLSTESKQKTAQSAKQSVKNKKVYDEDIFGQEFDINF